MDSASVVVNKIVPLSENHLDSMRNLISAAECLTEMGLAQNKPNLVQMGQTYVGSVLDTELKNWESVCQTYSDEGSGIWGMVSVGDSDDGGDLIGSIACLRISSIELELKRMYVRADHRRKGLGKQLLEFVFKHAASLGSETPEKKAATRISLTTPELNAGGIAFYKSMGFVLENTFTVELGGEDLNLVQMSRNL